MQVQHEELSAIIAIGYDHYDEVRTATILSADGIAERLLRTCGPNELADNLGLFDLVDHRCVKVKKYKSNVYRVSATIEIIDGEFADLSQIVISEPLLAESALYV